MSIVLQGSTSGSITLQEPAVAGSTVLDLPATSGTIITTGSSGQSIPKAALPTGSVLQVVQATTQTSTSTTSTSYVATNLTATITPTSSTSKILVTAACPMQTTGAAGGGLSIYRGATKIFDPSAADGASSAYYIMYGLSGGYISIPLVYLDSPSTTSAVTYTIYIASYSGTVVRMPFAGSVTNSNAVITLMEIAA